MAFHVDQIDHVEVFVTDPEMSAVWYERALGLEVTSRYDPEPIMVGAGDTKLALFQKQPGSDAIAREDETPLGRWHRVAWRTNPEGFKTAQEHLTRMQVEFRGPIDHGNALSIYFADPDGNPLEITTDVDGAGGIESS